MTQLPTKAVAVEAPSELVPVDALRPQPAPFRVLYATDGSEYSKAAAEWLAQLPLPAGSVVRLVTVLADDTWEVPPYLRSAEREWALKNFEQAEALLRRPGVEIRHSLLIGEPAREILQEAAATPEDLLVLGTHGRSGLTGVLLGSVAVNVAKHASQPVVVARPARFGLKRIILGVDGTEHAALATGWLARMPLPEGTRVTVCHVLRPYAPMVGPQHIPSMWELLDEVKGQQTRGAEQLTHVAAEELAHAGLPVDSTVRTGDPAEELLRLTEEAEADLLVVGARGKSTIEAMLMGSVADRLLRHATCSVLIVHGRDEWQPEPDLTAS